jgi:hypothetical protein
VLLSLLFKFAVNWDLLHCNIKFLFTTFKEGARNEFLQLTDTSLSNKHYLLHVKVKLK